METGEALLGQGDSVRWRRAMQIRARHDPAMSELIIAATLLVNPAAARQRRRRVSNGGKGPSGALFSASS